MRCGKFKNSLVCCWKMKMSFVLLLLVMLRKKSIESCV